MHCCLCSGLSIPLPHDFDQVLYIVFHFSNITTAATALLLQFFFYCFTSSFSSHFYYKFLFISGANESMGDLNTFNEAFFFSRADFPLYNYVSLLVWHLAYSASCKNCLIVKQSPANVLHSLFLINLIKALLRFSLTTLFDRAIFFESLLQQIICNCTYNENIFVCL
jgi:hypothetical protein